MAHIQTESEWQEEMSAKIVEFVRHELYMELRYLKLALSQLQLKSDPDLRAFATDGAYLYVAPEWLIGIFEKNAQYLGRAYLHTVLHCIFSHLWIGGNRDRKTWHLACDIAVEYTIDQMQAECTKRILSWTRKQMYDRLKEQKQQKQAAQQDGLFFAHRAASFLLFRSGSRGTGCRMHPPDRRCRPPGLRHRAPWPGQSGDRA
mgnify:CR=1 FL=1